MTDPNRESIERWVAAQTTEELQRASRAQYARPETPFGRIVRDELARRARAAHSPEQRP